jgi:hypothetical protein
MKTNPPANLCAIPQPYADQLAALAPSIAFSVSRAADHYHSWDGDGPDPRDEGFDPCNVTVTARAIVRGQILEESAHLGGSYFRHDEPTGDVHGYLLQMLEEAAAGLLPNLPTPEAAQCGEVCEYLKATMRAEYDAQRAANA